MRFKLTALFLALVLLTAACGPAPQEEKVKAPGPEAVFQRLEIVSQPRKLSYETGETPDLTGLVINALYDDGGVIENVPYELQTEKIGKKTAALTVLCMEKTLNLPITVTVTGNKPEYSLAAVEEVKDSPVKGKTFFWLGSSVTYGAESEGETMADFIGKKYGVITVKEAVSGTTLARYKEQSYCDRLDAFLKSDKKPGHVDAFICQLSTNDTSYYDQFGLVTPDFMTDPELFDTNTAFGAMEYIIAVAKREWDCPVYFYTNPPTGKAAYGTLVEGLREIAGKWGVTVIDMYGDEEFNAISDAERELYMADGIHPTRAGYLKWWLPKFEEALIH
ncbi:MAG: SGNH/GDSL hydrolase family protein [Oscillospiraceae bacterium]|nr:SGNH/GDSL hydrolase family protein [Oscillospiraceae bacterium]